MSGKNVLVWILVIVGGALLGSFLGEWVGNAFPGGAVQNLFAHQISAGLNPAVLDLRVLEVTFGCMLKLNLASLIGIAAAGFIFRSFIK